MLSNDLVHGGGRRDARHPKASVGAERGEGPGVERGPGLLGVGEGVVGLASGLGPRDFR